MPVYGFRYGGKQITFRQIEFFQFVQFMIQTGGGLEMDASLVSVKAGLHIDQVVFGTFLEMFVIAFLLQLFLLSGSHTGRIRKKWLAERCSVLSVFR